MGFRTGFILTAVAFLAGTLFVASIYDFPLLYMYDEDESSAVVQAKLDNAEHFYMSLYNGPTAVSALLHGMVGLGIVGLIAKLHRWTEMAKWFDGISLGLYMAAVIMYGTVQIPNIRILADPTDKRLLLRSSIRTQRETVVKDKIKAGLLASDAVVDLSADPITPIERENTIKILAAGNTIILLLLAGVLLFQASEWWMERAERIEEDKRRAEEMRKLGMSSAGGSANSSSSNLAAASTADKKKQ